MELSLKDRVAIVTGGGSGIGRGIALGLAKAGANITTALHSSVTGRIEPPATGEGRRHRLSCDFQRVVECTAMNDTCSSVG